MKVFLAHLVVWVAVAAAASHTRFLPDKPWSECGPFVRCKNGEDGCGASLLGGGDHVHTQPEYVSGMTWSRTNCPYLQSGLVDISMLSGVVANGNITIPAGFTNSLFIISLIALT